MLETRRHEDGDCNFQCDPPDSLTQAALGSRVFGSDQGELLTS